MWDADHIQLQDGCAFDGRHAASTELCGALRLSTSATHMETQRSWTDEQRSGRDQSGRDEAAGRTQSNGGRQVDQYRSNVGTDN